VPRGPLPQSLSVLSAGYGWVQVMCHRCEAHASMPLDAMRRPPDTPIWKREAALKCPILPDAALLTRTMTARVRIIAMEERNNG